MRDYRSPYPTREARWRPRPLVATDTASIAGNPGPRTSCLHSGVERMLRLLVASPGCRERGGADLHLYAVV